MLSSLIPYSLLHSYRIFPLIFKQALIGYVMACNSMGLAMGKYKSGDQEGDISLLQPLTSYKASQCNTNDQTEKGTGPRINMHPLHLCHGQPHSLSSPLGKCKWMKMTLRYPTKCTDFFADIQYQYFASPSSLLKIYFRITVWQIWDGSQGTSNLVVIQLCCGEISQSHHRGDSGPSIPI